MATLAAWSDEETQVLKDQTANGALVKDIAKILGRSPQAIKGRARRIGLRLNFPPAPKPPVVLKSWDEHDIGVLRGIWDSYPTIKDIAKALGRSRHTIRRMQLHAGLPNKACRPETFTEEEKELILTMYVENQSPKALGEIIGRSRQAVDRKIRLLNLPRAKAPRPWTDHDLRFMTDLWGISTGTIAAGLGRTQEAVYRKARFIGLPPETEAAKRIRPAPPHPYAELDNLGCRWPLGHPREEGFHFCGERAVEGKSYCHEHMTVAYRMPRKDIEEIVDA